MTNSRKTPVLAAVVVIVVIALLLLSFQQGWVHLPVTTEIPDEAEGGYKEVTEPGHEDKPFVENPEGEKIVPEDKVPAIRFFNSSSDPKQISVPLHYRVKFINDHDQAYTLFIPDIGIEEELTPGDMFEASFYKICDCSFWLDELKNETMGTISVS